MKQAEGDGAPAGMLAGPVDSAVAHRFLTDALQGLRQPQKTVPSKHLYDARGAALLERIHGLKDFYPARSELHVLRTHAREMACLVGSRCLLIEYGAASSGRTRLLLSQLHEPAGYVPVDLSPEHVQRCATELARDHPGCEVLPLCGDYTEDFELPLPCRPVKRRAIFCPGAILGELDPPGPLRLLQRMAEVCGRGGAVLVGVQQRDDPAQFHEAYDDRQGLMAALNLNLLVRMNKELRGTFRLDAFRHLAFQNVALGRVELHLVSLRRQVARVGTEQILFEKGETIRTVCIYKYQPAELARLAAAAGFTVVKSWSDPAGLYSVHYLCCSS